jgi:hypothetical protein
MTPPVIEVQIGALVLQGFPAGDQRAIAEAFQSALTEALGAVAARGELPPSLTRPSVARELAPASFQVPRGASAGVIAASAAACLANGLGKGGQR